MGRRLALLVAVQVALSLGVVVISTIARLRVESELQLTERFVLPPTEEIAVARQTSGELYGRLAELGAPQADAPNVAAARKDLDQLRAFLARYRAVWLIQGNPSPDAQAFREILASAGAEHLAQEEAAAVRELDAILDHLSETGPGRGPLAADARQWVERGRAPMSRLLDVNTAYLRVTMLKLIHDSRRMRLHISLLAGFTILVLMLMGLHVRRALAPRIERLVEKVQRFRDFGVNEPLGEVGRDEISVLARALDLGFAAISARDRERRRFLAITAHELKTPMTSIVGFTQAALQRPEDPVLRTHALGVINRQANRLKRLIEELLWAARAGSHELPFHPVPIDLVALVRRVVLEVEAASPNLNATLTVQDPMRVLGDEELLTHAVWSMVTYALALSDGSGPPSITLDRTADGRPRLVVRVRSSTRDPEELERSFEPFSLVQYEDRGGSRCAAGLYLCREIARMHGGTLQAFAHPGVGPVFQLELPL